MSDVDVLLLSLEVEAAAARNAELSRRVNELQSLLLSSSAGCSSAAQPHSNGTQSGVRADSTPAASRNDALPTPASQSIAAFSSKAAAKSSGPSEDLTFALVNMDDAIFDLAEVLTLLYPAGTNGEDAHTGSMASTRRAMSGGTGSFTSITNDFLSQAKAVKVACQQRLETFDQRSAELQKQLASAHAQLASERQSSTDERRRLETTIRELQVQAGSRHPEDLLTADHLDLVAHMRTANETLTVENGALKAAMEAFKSDLALRL